MDLNELNELTNDLRKRVGMKPEIQRNKMDTITYMAVQEHGRPFENGTEKSREVFKSPTTRMSFQEYEQPSKNRSITLMGVYEHGQPYK